MIEWESSHQNGILVNSLTVILHTPNHNDWLNQFLTLREHSNFYYEMVEKRIKQTPYTEIFYLFVD